VTKKQQRLLFTGVILLGGGYMAIRYWPYIQYWLQQRMAGGGQQTQPATTQSDTGGLAGILSGLATAIGSLFKGGSDGTDPTLNVDIGGLDGLADALAEATEGAGAAGGASALLSAAGGGSAASGTGAAAGAAAGSGSGVSALEIAAKVAVPLLIGAGAFNETIHSVNVGLTHAIGQETATDKGFVQIWYRENPNSQRQTPLLFNPNTNKAYGFNGREYPMDGMDPDRVTVDTSDTWAPYVEEMLAKLSAN